MAKIQSLTINDTGSLNLPSGTSAQRPNQATTLVSYTTVGTTTWTCPAGVTSVEVLVVGGGGGGAWGNVNADGNGGGGGGGVLYFPAYPVTPGTGYTVIVGGGGATGSPVSASRGSPGGNSQFHTQIAYGGGGGGSDTGNQDGLSGGSGGGASTSGPGGVGGAGTQFQGFPGGNANSPGGAGPGGGGGGGGGAGGPGGTGNQSQPGGVGGPGVLYSITGQERAYGGGGGGASWTGPGGAGGSGVGGIGASRTPYSSAGTAGTNGYGGGGGGGTGGGGGPYGGGSGGVGGSGCVHIRYNTNDVIGFTHGALRYNTARGIEYSTGGETAAGFTTYGKHSRFFLPFLTRTVINTAYVAGGYKDGVPWRNVNRTVAATDVTTNLGDQLTTQTNYKPGGCSKNIGYAWGATASNAAASNVVVAFNMRTEVSYTLAGSTTLTNSASYNAAIFKEHYKSFIHGGANYPQIDEYNMMTETTIGHVTSIFQDYSWGMSHENFGLIYASDNNTRAFHFAVNTAVTRSGTHPSAHHQQKSVQSKLQYCYAGNEGNYAGGNNLRRTNMVSDVTSGTVGKPVGNSGEENLTLGQHHQYMLGMYNGAQNNVSWKFWYASESGASVGATTEPKGQAGMSSAICFWRD